MSSSATPTTLRARAGLSDRIPALADSTLMIIDAQHAYSARGSIPLDNVGLATQRIAELLGRARAASAPIIHVAHTGPPGTPFHDDGGGRFMPEVAAADGEPVVTKLLPNSFAGTTLGEQLARLGPRPLVLCGFMTHMCVSSTARAALDLGFETTVVGDATATRDLPDPAGLSVLTADEVHHSALAALADRFSTIAQTSQLL